LSRFQFVKPGPDQGSILNAEGVVRYPPVEHEFAGNRVIQGLGKKIVEFKDLDAALLHLQCEIVVVLLGFMHPDDVIEE
jgi:hypothetical protein